MWKKLELRQFKYRLRSRIKKLTFSAKVMTEEKIIILCRIIIDDLININSKLLSFKFFVTHKHLIFFNPFRSIRFLIDIKVFDYTFIYFNLIDQICDRLSFESISYSKLKRLRDYDDVISFIVTHVIYWNIRINNYKQFIVLIFNADSENL